MSAWVAPGAPVTFERTDQGVDVRTTPGGAIVAPYPGTVHVARSNPGGFGTHYPTITFDPGTPLAGETWYVGHTLALRSGHVNAGDPISQTGHGTESWVGNATGIPGHAEIGRLLSGGGYPSMSAGAAIKQLVLGGAGTGAGPGAATVSAPLGSAITGAATGAVGDVAGQVASGLLGPLVANGFRMLLYAGLVLGGVALAVLGLLRAAGHNPRKAAQLALA